MRFSSCAGVFGAVLLMLCATGQGWAQNTPPPLYTPANASAPLSTRVDRALKDLAKSLRPPARNPIAPTIYFAAGAPAT